MLMDGFDPNDPTLLATAANSFEAALIVGVLDVRGIESQEVGGNTSNFQTGIPGEVQIMVRNSDLASAQAALSQCRPSEKEWDELDVGRATD